MKNYLKNSRSIYLFFLLSFSSCMNSRSDSNTLVDAPRPSSTAADAGESGFFTNQFILPPETYPANHGSTLVEIKSGHLMSCWFAGSREAARDVQIYCSEKHGAQEWTAPRVVVRRGENSRGIENKFLGNPVLFKDLEGYVWLFYEVTKAFGHSAALVDYKVSSDGGKTFSQGRSFAGSVTDFGHLPRNKPIQLNSGRFLVPLYKEFPKKIGYTVLVSAGKGQIKSSKTTFIPGSDHLQPALTMIEGADGANKVLAYLRDRKAQKVLVSVFEFSANRFSNVHQTNLPNPNAAVDAVSTDMNSILIAYNDATDSRSKLSLALSEDGFNFRKIIDLESQPGEYSYPCLIRGQNGDYHLTYTYDRKTIKYVNFDSKWLASRN